jgi:hypothetical protein
MVLWTLIKVVNGLFTTSSLKLDRTVEIQLKRRKTPLCFDALIVPKSKTGIDLLYKKPMNGLDDG